ncbi:MAG TPA: SIR2 family protein [Gemmataceae bacterium]|jgi:hypothetical protein
MPGHVFIVRGDLRRLVCDGWLMPASREGRPEPKWLRPDAPEPDWPDPPADFRNGERRVLEVSDRPADQPRPWLVNLDAGPDAPADWFLDGACQFLAAAGPAAKGAPVTGRAKPLLALPIINNAPEPLRPDAARVVAGLLPLLLDAVKPGAFDVALVAHDGPAFAAAQAARAQAGGGWPGLGPNLRRKADELAAFATRGELALFLGAGVSAGAGVPLWGELLDQLARRAGMSDCDRTALRRLHLLDQAGVIERRLGGADELREAVRDLSARDHYGLTHALLASLPVREAVTTNYDELFEVAWEARGRRPSVLPYRLRPKADAWVLQMHGSVSHPEDIVLTREHQLAYEDRHAALAGIVQTLLLTRHMLFVGFSLSDDDFHRIADDVRRVLRSLEAPADGKSPAGKPFGTAVVLRRRRLVEELWGDDLRWVGMGRAGGRDPARRLEVFLDYLLTRTRDTAHLLDARYERLLDGGERALRAALTEFVRRAPAAARSAAAWHRVERFLSGLGYRGDS